MSKDPFSELPPPRPGLEIGPPTINVPDELPGAPADGDGGEPGLESPDFGRQFHRGKDSDC